jgi:hypothetical protein
MNKITAYAELLQIPEDCFLNYPDYLFDHILHNFYTYNRKKLFGHGCK